MHSTAFEIFLWVLLFSIKEGLRNQVGRNPIVGNIADSGGNSLEAVLQISIDINVVDIFSCCGVVQSDWEFDVSFEPVRDRLVEALRYG